MSVLGWREQIHRANSISSKLPQQRGPWTHPFPSTESLASVAMYLTAIITSCGVINVVTEQPTSSVVKSWHRFSWLHGLLDSLVINLRVGKRTAIGSFPQIWGSGGEDSTQVTDMWWNPRGRFSASLYQNLVNVQHPLDSQKATKVT
jgi:hypothetical protein